MKIVSDLRAEHDTKLSGQVGARSPAGFGPKILEFRPARAPRPPVRRGLFAFFCMWPRQRLGPFYGFPEFFQVGMPFGRAELVKAIWVRTFRAFTQAWSQGLVSSRKLSKT